MNEERDPNFAPGERFRAERDSDGLTIHDRPLTFGEFFRTGGPALLVMFGLMLGFAIDAFVKQSTVAIVMCCLLTLLAGLVIWSEQQRKRQTIKGDSRVLRMSAGGLTLLRTDWTVVRTPAHWPLEHIRQIGGGAINKQGLFLRLWQTDGTFVDLLRCDEVELRWLAAVLNAQLLEHRETIIAPRAEVRPA